MVQPIVMSAVDERVSSSQEAKTKAWYFFALFAITGIVLAAIAWSLAHPYGIHWDEAQYLNDIQIDAQRLRTGHLLKLIGRLFIRDLGRPPAYRMLALPFAAIFGYHTTEARLVSIACFALTAFFVFLAVRHIATPIAGALASLIFALSPEVISGSIFYSTDAPLYLATAAMLYFMFVTWTDSETKTSTWVGLGCAVGLGFLAKTTFILIAPPVLIFWLVARFWDRSNLPSLTSQWKPAILAFVIAGPWWILSGRQALAYGKYARGFVGNSLGSPSVGTWLRWFNSVVQCLLGLSLAILIALVVVFCLLKFARRRATSFSDLQITALGAAACAGLPIVLEQLSGTNHLLRHITPSMVPLAIAVGVFASVSGWLSSWLTTAVSMALLLAQFVVLVRPVIKPNRQLLDLGFPNASLPSTTMSRFDQWDWHPVMNLADTCHIETPQIGVVGAGRQFNPPAIQFPWMRRVTSTNDIKLAVPEVTWLWRSDGAAFDWNSVMHEADASDMVITAPQYLGDVSGKNDPDDQHNAEFAEHLARDDQFQSPVLFQMGRFRPIEVAVFVKKTFSCSFRPKS